MKKLFIYFVAACLCACSGDDTGTLAPSGRDIDWFALEDSSDPLDHARYGIYSQYGISVYYDDVLGTEERGTDGYGDPIIHTEYLDPFYNVTGFDLAESYTLSSDRDALAAAVGIFESDIIPNLIPGRLPRTILLVDKLIYTDPTSSSNTYEQAAWVGARTVIIGKVGALAAMTVDQLATYQSEVLGAVWYDYVRRHYTEQLDQFWAVSQALWTASRLAYDTNPNNVIIYNQLVSTSPMPTDPQWLAQWNATKALYRNHWTKYAFLTNSLSKPTVSPNPSVPDSPSWYTPTQMEDAISFFGAAISMAEAQFTAKYEDDENPAWPQLLQKFRMIEDLIQTIKTDTAQ